MSEKDSKEHGAASQSLTDMVADYEASGSARQLARVLRAMAEKLDGKKK